MIPKWDGLASFIPLHTISPDEGHTCKIIFDVLLFPPFWYFDAMWNKNSVQMS